MMGTRAVGKVVPVVTLALLMALAAACSGPAPEVGQRREAAIPGDVIKGTPDNDHFPPLLQAEGWERPVPLAGPVTTAGAEDSPFILPDGRTLYFFFTPDVRVPVEEQVVDGVTGLWAAARNAAGDWADPRRVVLHDDVSMEGCAVVRGDTLWFASVRAGNLGEVDVYTAGWRDGAWRDWENAGRRLNLVLNIGEFDITPDGRFLYFGWEAGDGCGGRDIWVVERVGDDWGEPENLGPGVNSGRDEDQPCLTPDGSELWFTGDSRLGYAGPAVFRSIRGADGTWGPAEEIISQFAGEPTVDAAGDVYFVHHYFTEAGEMIEADIYIARRR